MKKIPLIVAFLTIFNLTPGLATIPMKIYGNVEQIYCGEMDPFQVGDVCVLFIQDKMNNKVWGRIGVISNLSK
jgi:hypothetical protein